MEARLARATIEVMNDCGFKVYGLEVAGGNENGTARWAYATDDAALATGDVRELADAPPSVPSSGVMGRPYNASLASGVVWDVVGVVSLWEVGQDGALTSGRSLASTLLQDLSSGSATRDVRAESFTVFTDCAELAGDGLHLRWSLMRNASGVPVAVEFGMEGPDIVSSGYVAFGPADPARVSGAMIGSDPVVAGFLDGDVTRPYAVDTYLSSYSTCDTTGSVTGVCADATWGGLSEALATSAAASPEVKLRAAERVNSVSMFRWRRPLSASSATDHPINVSVSTEFVWAVGGVDTATAAGSQHLPNMLDHGRTGRGVKNILLDSATVQYCASTLRYTEPARNTVGQGAIPPASTFDFTVTLSSNVIKMSWTLNPRQSSANFRVECTRSGNWASVAWGEAMGDAYAFIGYVNAAGSGTGIGVRTYKMSGYSASSVAEVSSTITGVSVEQSPEGKVTFMFTAKVGDRSGGSQYFSGWNVPVLWAVGDTWTEGSGLQASNVHSARSPSPVFIDLSTGKMTAAEPNWVLILHGIFLFAAWGVGIPAAVLIARFLKFLPNAFWFTSHTRINYGAALIGIAGIVLSFVDGFKRQLHFNSTHGILGLSVALLWIAQVLFATIARPEKDAGTTRVAWEIGHRAVAVICLVLSFVTIGFGIDSFELRTGEDLSGYTLAFQIWSGLIALIAVLWQVHTYINPPAGSAGSAMKDAQVDGISENNEREGVDPKNTILSGGGDDSVQ